MFKNKTQIGGKQTESYKKMTGHNMDIFSTVLSRPLHIFNQVIQVL